MTIRTTSNPLIRAAGRWLERANDRHPWNHNDHFHPWILRSLPAAPARVLDVGCGRGELVAALAGRAGIVEGIDPDAAMAYATATRFQSDPRVRIARRTLTEQVADPTRAGQYDAVTMVASLHHMDMSTALTEARALLRPGGRLLIVTLTRPRTPADHAWDVLSALLNPLIGLAKHPRPVRPMDRLAGAADRSRRPMDRPAGARDRPRQPTDPEAPAAATPPLRDPQLTIDELREVAAELLPGARIRRRQGFRVTLSWRKPLPRL